MTVDLVGLPAMLAFFMFGLDAALDVAIITALIITLIAPTTWIGASMKFAGTLPMFLFPALYVLSKKKSADITKILINLFIVTLLSLLVLVLSGNANLFSKQFIGEMDQTLYITPTIEVLKVKGGNITLSSLLLGLLPIITIALSSYLILLFWKRYAKGVKSSAFSNPFVMLYVTIASIFIRGITMVIANYYYAGPIFFRISTEELMKIAPWYLIFGWNAFQGIIEVATAWVIAFKFKFIEKYGIW
jgi:riboflavin transporter FmnP